MVESLVIVIISFFKCFTRQPDICDNIYVYIYVCIYMYVYIYIRRLHLAGYKYIGNIAKQSETQHAIKEI